MKKHTLNLCLILILLGSLAFFQSRSMGNNNNNPDLLDAVWEGNAARARTLLAHKANVDTKAKHKLSLLYIATLYGKKPLVRTLLAYKATVDAADLFGQTPLFRAAQNGNEPILRALLAHKANINATDKHGKTPLYEAMRRGNEPMVRTLLEHKANINTVAKNGITPLFRVALWGNESMVHTLLENGADFTIKNKQNKTAREVAQEKQNQKVVRLIEAEKEKWEFLHRLSDAMPLMPTVLQNIITLYCWDGMDKKQINTVRRAMKGAAEREAAERKKEKNGAWHCIIQ